MDGTKTAINKGVIMNVLSTLIYLTLLSSGLPSNQNIVDLLLETCAVESDFGKYDRQIGGGPARGIFQMEPSTAVDIVNNYVSYRRKLIDVVGGCNYEGDVINLLDDRTAIIMACIHYLRVKAPVPSTRLGRARYWKKYYNTDLGKGTVEKYMEKASLYIGAEYED